AAQLQALLTDKVTISNPFDFHTHVWFDRPALRSLFSTVHRAGYDVTGLMIDCPPCDRADPATYVTVIDQYIAAFPGAPARAAVICSLPESMAPATRAMCFSAGIMPLQGQREALEALDLAGEVGETWASNARVALQIPGARHSPEPHGREQREAAGTRTLTEYAGKAALAAFGLSIPRSVVVSAREVAAAAQSIGFPVVIKATGAHLEHKSELGAVAVNIGTTPEAEAAAQRLAKLSDSLLVEQMIGDGIAEILVGMTVDPQFGQVLVLGAGGVLTELLRDTVSILPPFTTQCVEVALRRLNVEKLLSGLPGKPPRD